MAIFTSALAGVLPLAGAVALTLKGAARWYAKRDRPPYVPPRPKELVSSAPTPGRRRKGLPDATCATRGTSIPGTDKFCPSCKHKRTPASNTAATTALHWLVFLAMMFVVFGTGAILAP